MSDQSVSEELARERRDLIKAEIDITEGSQRVDEQHRLIERLVEQGHDINQARTLLVNLEQMLDAWRVHRSLIMQRIRVLEQK